MEEREILSERVWKFEAMMPRVDTVKRAEALMEALNSPGNWSRDVVRRRNVVAWTFEIPEEVEMTFTELTWDMFEQVGYYCSGTTSAFAKVRFAGSDGVFGPWHVVRGAW